MDPTGSYPLRILISSRAKECPIWDESLIGCPLPTDAERCGQVGNGAGEFAAVAPLDGSWNGVPRRASWLAMRNTLRCAIKNEDVGGLFNQFKRVVNLACNPLLNAEPVYFHHRRLRPSNVFVNLLLLLGATGWNMVFLPQTLVKRRAALQKVELAAQALGPDPADHPVSAGGREG